jgi:leucyl aminopeptidase
MPDRPEIAFASLSTALEPVAVVLAGEDLALGGTARRLVDLTKGAIMRAAEASDFKGRAKSSIELLGLDGHVPKRLILVGTGRTSDAKDKDWFALGGYAYGVISARKTATASIVAEVADAGSRSAADIAADLAMGALLRSYRFGKYLTKKPEPNGEPPPPEALARITVHTQDPDGARAAFVRHQAVADGIFLARDLVNEPANVLGPIEFADRCRPLAGAGVEVEVLDVEALKALGMNCLLAVAQGSERPARVVVMQWNGAKTKRANRAKPLCFLGKGVCFDTGGISIKPAAGMEDMKGDMAGAAAVVGLMQALAGRRAAVNAIGIIGLVENMPSANAQRPGDIVTSMSGQTVEVLNTDAEGRLVLADLMWYAQERFRPKLIVDLATLTGAIIMALGKEYAGLFATDDRLAQELLAAGDATGERLWRMPLDRAYDKLLDSRNADMKNIGGRHAGAITAAHFIGRFVKGTPWAHLDVAGVAMDSGKTDISQGWASGWGVRLLDRFIATDHEKT